MLLENFNILNMFDIFSSVHVFGILVLQLYVIAGWHFVAVTISLLSILVDHSYHYDSIVIIFMET